MDEGILPDQQVLVAVGVQIIILLVHRQDGLVHFGQQLLIFGQQLLRLLLQPFVRPKLLLQILQLSLILLRVGVLQSLGLVPLGFGVDVQDRFSGGHHLLQVLGDMSDVCFHFLLKTELGEAVVGNSLPDQS